MNIKNQTINKFFIVILFVSTLVFTACGSDDDNEMIEEDVAAMLQEEFANNLAMLDVPTAMKNSNNTYAQQATSQFTALKGIGSSFTAFFFVPDFAVTATNFKDDATVSARSAALNTQTYTWTEDGITVIYTITEESDRFRFNYVVESADISGKLMDGYQLKDASYAEVNLYDDNTLVSTIIVAIDGDVSTVEIKSDGIRYTLESNTTNNAGTLKLYEDNTLISTYTWEASGSGSFTNHSTGETFMW